MKILIVDDDRENFFLLQALLGPKHDCHYAPSSYSAVRMILEAIKTGQPFERYITDNDMIECEEGLRFIEERRNIGDKTPIIFMSGEMTESKETTAKKFGADVLKKPFDPRKLSAIVG